MGIITWLLQHTWRELIGAAVLAILIIGYVGWREHQRNIGEEECKQAQVAAFNAGQAAADKHATGAAAAVHAQYDPLAQAVTDADTRYHEAHASDGCAPVHYERKLKP